VKKKVVFCVPTITKPYPQTLDALKASIPLIQEAGWDEGMVSEVGCPYISAARATMLRKALDAKADVIVFIDHDVSWEPPALLKLIETEGDVVGGTYRFKKEEEEYMGSLLTDSKGYPLGRKDGCLKASGVPAGFLKVTRGAVNLFMKTLPHLKYGEECSPSVDLFNHGAHEGVWWGEDYAFCRNWTDVCGQNLWLIPDLNIDHHSPTTAYKGNFHQFMLRQPGGMNDPAKLKECANAR
jgi:glycosyltransferase involved in cell wall biosynthesis